MVQCLSQTTETFNLAGLAAVVAALNAISDVPLPEDDEEPVHWLLCVLLRKVVHGFREVRGSNEEITSSSSSEARSSTVNNISGDIISGKTTRALPLELRASYFPISSENENGSSTNRRSIWNDVARGARGETKQGVALISDAEVDFDLMFDGLASLEEDDDPVAALKEHLLVHRGHGYAASVGFDDLSQGPHFRSWDLSSRLVSSVEEAVVGAVGSISKFVGSAWEGLTTRGI